MLADTVVDVEEAGDVIRGDGLAWSVIVHDGADVYLGRGSIGHIADAGLYAAYSCMHA